MASHRPASPGDQGLVVTGTKQTLVMEKSREQGKPGLSIDVCFQKKTGRQENNLFSTLFKNKIFLIFMDQHLKFFSYTNTLTMIGMLAALYMSLMYNSKIDK